MPAANDSTTEALWFDVLTPRNFTDLERLLGPDGGDRGCWCRWWRHEPDEYDALTPQQRQRASAQSAGSTMSGVLAYDAADPVGWCAIGPGSESLPRRGGSRAWAPIDDRDVWSITCFFVSQGERGHGVARFLLRSAIDTAVRAGAQVIEAYPRDTRGDVLPDRSMYFGSLGMFLDAGFTEVARKMDAFPVVRLQVAARP